LPVALLSLVLPALIATAAAAPSPASPPPLASSSPASSPRHARVPKSRCSLAVAPIALSLARLDPATPGVSFRLTLTATAQVACADATLEIQLPPGTSPLEGTARWQGSMAQGEQRVLEITTRVPDGSLRRFLGVAEVRSGASLLARQTLISVGTAPRTLAAPRQAPVVVAPDGTHMLVLPAREVSP
jgi:hypothetical protein